MMTKPGAVLIAVMLVTPATLTAQNAGAQGGAQAQAQTPQARIDAALSTAVSAGIPVELVQSKIAEGRAKAVAEERIAAAVEARVQGLVRASQTLQRAGIEARSAGDLSVTADAIDAGVSQAALVRISREAPPERRAVAIAVLADLVRLGQPVDDASARVSAAVTTSAALANLHAEVASQLRVSGLRPTLDLNAGVRIR